MVISNIRSKSWLPPIFVALFCMAMILTSPAEETKHARSSGLGEIVAPQPFNIFSSCPPASCIGIWDGLSDPASGHTDLTPAGVPLMFSFVTGSATFWQCLNNGCEATYGPGGSFSLTGALGTFTGQTTSGSASENGQGFTISVTFSGQWSNGQPMHGTADERYMDAFQIPDTELRMYPGP